MGKVEFLLKSKIEDIDVTGLKASKKEYFDLLSKNKFPKVPKNDDFYTMIRYFKRKDDKNPLCIGPYKNITPFEAANRIASDLVIINGLLQLIDTREKIHKALITLRLGATHQKGKGDFTIKLGNKEYEGEAFNVAHSFLDSKLRYTMKKWKDNSLLKYILINADALNGKKFDDERIFIVNDWEKR
jgi:hypothetical protein